MSFFRRLFLLFFFLISFSIASSAQATIKSLALSIQSQSSDPVEQSRLLFDWIASNIRYDLDANRDHSNADRLEAAQQTLRRKKGICEDYADLYCAVAEELQLTVLKVRGFCSQQGANDDLHTWLVVYPGDRWRLIDPTWGAGYRTDKGYVNQVNETYYDISPDSLIATHYPFDPIFQLLERPYTLEEFKRKEAQERKGMDKINFHDSLVEYNYASDIRRLQGEIARIKKAGTNHPLVKAFFQLLQRNLEIELYNDHVNIFNIAVDHFNEGQKLYEKLTKEVKNHPLCYEQLSLAARLLKSIDGKESSLQTDLRNMLQVLQRQLSRLNSPYPILENGDLIFVEMRRSDFSDAIVSVTKSADEYAFSHVGIVERNDAGIFVIEAIGKGVVATPIEEFFENPSYFRFQVARLRTPFQKYIPAAITEARRHIGKGYDWPFDFENDRYYCSELIYVAFAKSSGDNDFFPVTPMTFIDAHYEDYNPKWVRYFARLQCPIPEGKPGVSPGGLSLSEKISWVK